MRNKRGIALVLSVWLLLLSACGAKEPADHPLSGRIANADEVVLAIRRGLRGRARSITVTFDYGSDIFTELNGVIDAWVEAALAETDDPAEGDYIRYQYGGYAYNSSYTVTDDRWKYTVKITPEYYSYLSQEEAVTEKVGELMPEFGFRRRTSDYEKIRTIYDYICRNVRYDKVHRKNPYSHLKSTAYSALILGTATCQGYCAALYRLLREAGIDCRIVTGTGSGEDGVELHAWVVAGLDGLYYALDPTWDAGAEEYRFFLLGEAELADRAEGDRFRGEGFTARYPMAAESYVYDGD